MIVVLVDYLELKLADLGSLRGRVSAYFDSAVEAGGHVLIESPDSAVF